MYALAQVLGRQCDWWRDLLSAVLLADSLSDDLVVHSCMPLKMS